MRISSKLNSHYWVIISILISIIVFGYSTYSLFSNIKRPQRDIEIILSDTTRYQLGEHGDLDTLHIGGGIAKRRYFDSIKVSNIKIHPIDNFTVKNRFYYKSKLISNSIFTHIDSNYLVNRINFLDNNFYRFENEKYKESSFFLNRNPKILIWILLISCLLSISLSLIPFYFWIIKDSIKHQLKSNLILNFISSFLILFILLIPFILVDKGNIVNFVVPSNVDEIWNIGFTKNSIIGVATLPYVGVLFWLTAILTINSKLSSVTLNSNEVKNYLSTIDILIFIMSALLVFGVICTDVLNNFMNELLVQNVNFKLFPNDFVIMNGIVQSFLLLMIYSFVSINISELKKMAQSNEEDSITNFGNGRSIKIALAIIAPFLSSTIEPLLKVITG